MKTQYVLLVSVLLSIGCGHPNHRSNTLPVNVTEKATISAISKKQTDSISNLTKFRVENLNSNYKNYKIYKLNESINEDFNGDGVVDKARFIKQRKSGIIITDGKSHKETKLGFGEEFAHLTDFDWVDYWGVLKDKTTFEIIFDSISGDILGDSIRPLKNISLFVEQDEVGGGVITYKNGTYKWIHQAD